MATNGAPKSPPSHKPNIVIIGGSLGGLFAGVALKTHGYITTILERAPTKLLHNQGAGIVAGGDTIEFFARYDRTGKPVAVPSHKRLYLDLDGRVVHEEVNRQNMTSWDLCYYLLRANYDRVDSPYLAGAKLPEIRETDGAVTYRYGCTVTGLEDLGSQVRITFRSRRGRQIIGDNDSDNENSDIDNNNDENDDDDNDVVEESIIADLVVAADGPSSMVRSLVESSVERTYAGYCVIRGTVPEPQGSPAALDVFRERFCFYHAPGIQNLTYTIAGTHGDTRPGHRLLNFVWYANFPADGPEFARIMTDKHGRRRRITVPPGMMAWEAWEQVVLAKAETHLPPQMAEMARKTDAPFVQAITDVIAPKNLYLGDKVVLVGDALAGFRPHTVASTSQAAFNVMSLVDWLDGRIGRAEYVKQVMQYARTIQQRGVRMGNRSQFESLPLHEYIADRNLASTRRADEVYEDWTLEGLNQS